MLFRLVRSLLETAFLGPSPPPSDTNSAANALVAKIQGRTVRGWLDPIRRPILSDRHSLGEPTEMEGITREFFFFFFLFVDDFMLAFSIN